MFTNRPPKIFQIQMVVGLRSLSNGLGCALSLAESRINFVAAPASHQSLNACSMS